jgi:hypothetical protein
MEAFRLSPSLCLLTEPSVILTTSFSWTPHYTDLQVPWRILTSLYYIRHESVAETKMGYVHFWYWHLASYRVNIFWKMAYTQMAETEMGCVYSWHLSFDSSRVNLFLTVAHKQPTPCDLIFLKMNSVHIFLRSDLFLAPITLHFGYGGWRLEVKSPLDIDFLPFLRKHKSNNLFI